MSYILKKPKANSSGLIHTHIHPPLSVAEAKKDRLLTLFCTDLIMSLSSAAFSDMCVNGCFKLVIDVLRWSLNWTISIIYICGNSFYQVLINSRSLWAYTRKHRWSKPLIRLKFGLVDHLYIAESA